jgi:hypothetical protein
LYLCLEFRYPHSHAGKKDEKGIRCKTGAVPAAVSPSTESESNATAFKAGRCRLPGEPEDLPDYLHYFLLSGKIAKVNCISLSFILSIGQKACEILK